jgi:hypothetical protein
MNVPNTIFLARAHYYSSIKKPTLDSDAEYYALMLETSKNEYIITVLEELNTIKECVINKTVYHTHLNKYDLGFLKSTNPYKYSSVKEIGELYSYFKIYKANYLYETKSRVELKSIFNLANKGIEYLKIPVDIVIWNSELKKHLNFT